MDSNGSSTTISFDAQGMRLDTSEDAETICHELACEEVEILILQGNTIGVEAAERMRYEFIHHPELKEAHFKDIFTSRGREEVPIAMNHLLKGITEGGAKLTLLDLSDNAIGPIGAPSVIEFLESSSAETIEKLYLNNCGLGPEGSTSIAACIPRLRRLREFICGRNRLENKGATNMSRALMELNSLEVLKLPQNGINVKGIKSLCDVLQSNISTIKEIDLSDNTIKAEGAESLDVPISRAKNLQVLKLDDALLQNTGFSIICDSLSKSQVLGTMREATFEGNELRGSKVIDLIEYTFSQCRKDFTLNLLANEFKRSDLKRLQDFGDSRGFKIIVDDPEDCPSSDEDEDDEQDSDDDENSCSTSDDETTTDDESDQDSGDRHESTTRDTNKSTKSDGNGGANSSFSGPFNFSFGKLEI